MEERVDKTARWGERWRSLVLTGAAAMADFVFPPICLGCGAMTGGHGAVCSACWGRLAFIEKPYCPILGMPFSHDMGQGIVSAEAIADPPRFDRARAAFLYDDLARNLVHGLKYRDRTDLARTMARWMLRVEDGYVAECEAIVAVPLHRRRLMRRQYNQSAELARALAGLAGRRFLPGALVRRKATKQQIGLGARQRRENVRGAFAVSGFACPDLVGRRIVLVDDVYTTGATVNAVATVLKRAGVAEVTVLTFARVDPHHI